MKMALYISLLFSFSAFSQNLPCPNLNSPECVRKQPPQTENNLIGSAISQIYELKNSKDYGICLSQKFEATFGPCRKGENYYFPNSYTPLFQKMNKEDVSGANDFSNRLNSIFKEPTFKKALAGRCESWAKNLAQNFNNLYDSTWDFYQQSNTKKIRTLPRFASARIDHMIESLDRDIKAGPNTFSPKSNPLVNFDDLIKTLSDSKKTDFLLSPISTANSCRPEVSNKESNFDFSKKVMTKNEENTKVDNYINNCIKNKNFSSPVNINYLSYELCKEEQTGDAVSYGAKSAYSIGIENGQLTLSLKLRFGVTTGADTQGVSQALKCAEEFYKKSNLRLKLNYSFEALNTDEQSIVNPFQASSSSNVKNFGAEIEEKWKEEKRLANDEHFILLHKDHYRANTSNWPTSTTSLAFGKVDLQTRPEFFCTIVTHEISHLLGLLDDYKEAGLYCPSRDCSRRTENSFIAQNSLMAKAQLGASAEITIDELKNLRSLHGDIIPPSVLREKTKKFNNSGERLSLLSYQAETILSPLCGPL